MPTLAPPPRSFSTADEVARAAGVSKVTLREWVRRGLLPAPIEVVAGRGNLVKYPAAALERAQLARTLRNEGWTLDAIAAHMRKLEET